MYDAIVIGAGSTHCTVAKLLLERWMRTRLVERHKISWYKSYSGQLAAKMLRLSQAYFRAEILVFMTCAPAASLYSEGRVLQTSEAASFLTPIGEEISAVLQSYKWWQWSLVSGMSKLLGEIRL